MVCIAAWASEEPTPLQAACFAAKKAAAGSDSYCGRDRAKTDCEPGASRLVGRGGAAALADEASEPAAPWYTRPRTQNGILALPASTTAAARVAAVDAGPEPAA